MHLTKTVRKDGSSYKVLLKTFAGICYHSKMKLSYGRKLVKGIAIVQGSTSVTCIDEIKNSYPPPLCGKGYDVKSPYYREWQNYIGRTHSSRWISIKERETWPSRDHLNKKKLAIFGLQSNKFAKDSKSWKAAVQIYWSLLSPLIFSDHPKKPGDKNPPPPYNKLRNVLDMNAHVGGFNYAMLQAEKSIWNIGSVPSANSRLSSLPPEPYYRGETIDIPLDNAKVGWIIKSLK
ncbi:Putative pectin methyltransferase QUA2 [Glycine soja]|uniref:Methyltransferase n=1 Tax=Glycine soja TaxID=3848 RepID=A0A0B2PMG2_GLYSO|nr:Putative pectin methyltransferase QUA2 [Glycine soja]